jgi:hypothetical protein
MNKILPIAMYISMFSDKISAMESDEESWNYKSSLSELNLFFVWIEFVLDVVCKFIFFYTVLSIENIKCKIWILGNRLIFN